MISNFIRLFYYKSLSIPMRVNGWRYRLLSAPCSGLRVHLGCGQKHYIAGWVNVDANIVSARPDLWINLVHRLPFRDNSVSIFYSYHVIEHLPADRLPGFFGELYRCLEPGGGLRIGVPHAGNAYRMYAAGCLEWFSSDFPKKRQSLGGRCENFLLCGNEHLTLFDFTLMQELLAPSGFVEVEECLPCRESSLVGEDVLSQESESDFEVPHTLVVQARKPVASSASGPQENGQRRR